MSTAILSSFTVHLAITDYERDQAYEFIKERAQESHDSAPPPLPKIVLAASEETGNIVGTFGMDFGDTDTPLPCESCWTFDRTTTPLRFLRKRMVQYGRWFTNRQYVSLRLVYMGACCAKEYRRVIGICEIKKPVVDRLTRLGIRMLPIVGARINLDAIPEEGRPYYMTEPFPQLMMVRVVDLIRATQNR